MRHLSPSREERGFTLVELLVVIIIIGILASVAIPIFLNQRQRANDASVTADVKNIANTLEGLHIANNTAPGSYSITSTDGKRVTITAGDLSEAGSLSNGVALTVMPSSTPGAFRLCGWHENGKSYRDKALVYDSALGGLQKATVDKSTCAPLPADWPVTETGGDGLPGLPTNIVLQANLVGPAVQYLVSWEKPTTGGDVSSYDVTVKGMQNNAPVAQVSTSVAGTQTSATLTKNWTQDTDQVIAEVVAVNDKGSSSSGNSASKPDVKPDRETVALSNPRFNWKYRSDSTSTYELAEVSVTTPHASAAVYYIMSGKGYDANGKEVTAFLEVDRKNAVKGQKITLSGNPRFTRTTTVKKAVMTVTAYDLQKKPLGSSSFESIQP